MLDGHVVEQHHRGARRDRLLDLLHAVALDLDRAAGPHGERGARTASVIVETGEVVVLHEHQLRQRAPVVHPSAGTDRRLLERAQAGQRLARVPDAGTLARSFDEPTREGGNARQVAEEVQRRALAGEHAAQRATDLAQLRARADGRAVVDRPLDHDPVVELGEHLRGAAGSGDHAGRARDDVGGGRARRQGRPPR